ncbi:aromatic amino acid aminotransferase [Bacillus canaveralius]|uniref:Aminotransferase n=1 Tax=Bacillus canaveralius TaxID=1403243 RepID=A0A2N5GJM8_9BACI|nr:aminotransferase A [Bacillus canaveralius]PLR81412.1 aromatic amino acid aminotransferase [Bacillus canaveralius]PLR90049.1 aromatic amino acid aminotransferase [Bacillus canaveralius]RSK53073.1 aminotransferase A [Bacillus canaveralius]
MEHLINNRVKQLEISGIRKFFNMVAGTEDMISLTIGQPDFPTPAHVKEAGKKAIDDNFTSYTHNAGLLELREAAADFYKKKYSVDYNPSSEVIVTTGASEAIDIAFRTILEEGTEVILPGPVYPGYEPIVRLCDAKPVYIDTREHQFKLTAELIEPYINDKTRCIVLPYPSNPTGVSMNEQELYDIAAMLEKKEIFVLADEIYSELAFERPHASIAKFLRDKTIVINGLSKSHAMTGWRIGLLYAPEYITKHILKVHQYNVTCASSISQAAALAALTNGLDDSVPMREEYRKRRDYVYKRLLEMGLETVKPDGAFYFFVKIPNVNTNSFEFALSLVEEAKVAVVPGSAFSSLGEGYFRLSYAYSLETLEEGLNRLQDYLTKNRG